MAPLYAWVLCTPAPESSDPGDFPSDFGLNVTLHYPQDIAIYPKASWEDVEGVVDKRRYLYKIVHVAD